MPQQKPQIHRIIAADAQPADDGVVYRRLDSVRIVYVAIGHMCGNERVQLCRARPVVIFLPKLRKRLIDDFGKSAIMRLASGQGVSDVFAL